MRNKKTYLALDVGEKRIGVAVGDSAICIAVPFETIAVDGDEVTRVIELFLKEKATEFVVGYPRNQQGETTAQTAFVEEFAQQLTDVAPIHFQDESLTSVLAEERLKNAKKPYTKEDIDMNAAAIILQDFLEEQHGA